MSKKWIPLPDGPNEAHVGKRLRVVWNNGQSMVQDEVRRVASGKVTWLGGAGDNWARVSGDWFIHRDDVPADPDADLIERMARAVLDNFNGTGHGYRLNATQAARDALAVVREAGAR